jgi:hypothetical protein
MKATSSEAGQAFMTEQRTKDKDKVTLEGDLRVVAAMGNEHFEPGLTRLEPWLDGRCLVINRFEEKGMRVEGRIDPQRATRLLEQTTSGTFWRAKLGGGRGVPDEPRYLLEVYQGEARMHSCHMWQSECATHRDVGSLVAALQAVVKEVTNE